MKDYFFYSFPFKTKMFLRLFSLILPFVFLFKLYEAYHRFYYGLLNSLMNTSSKSFFFFLEINSDYVFYLLISIFIIPIISSLLKKILIKKS